MKYYLEIVPSSLEKILISESKRLVKEIYGKSVKNIFYRVQTKEHLDNPRKIFLKGDGRILEGEIKPHVSLIHNIELTEENIDGFIKLAKEISKKYPPFKLEFESVGNYGMNFTFFIKFKNVPKLNKLRSELLDLSKTYMSKEEYSQHISVKYTPHSTVLYDDIDPEKVKKAHHLLNISKFKKSILVKDVLLWEVTPTRQEVIAKFPLLGN